jgi:hypothetical protein
MADAPQANPQGLMSIGTVASHNIAAALALPAESVPQIEQAIKDEINAMSSHFTLAIADVQTQYEVETLKLKKDYEKAVSDFVWLKANKGKVAAVVAGVLALGALVGHFV